MNWTDEMKDELLACEIAKEVSTFSAKYGVSYANADRKRRKLRGSEKKGKTINEMVSDEKARMVHQLGDRERSELIRKASMVEMVVDAVNEALEPVQGFVIPESVRGERSKGDEEEAILDISDAQIGKKTKTYNSEVFAERIVKLANKTVLFADIARSDHPVNILNVFFKGDMPDGQGIYPTHSHHTDQNVVNQIFRTGIPATVDALAILASNFKEVRCYCIRGNHGRTGKFMEETSNWDMVYYYSLENATRHISNVKWNITDDWQMIANVMGKRFFLYHGNAIKMYLKTPIYGINTAGMGWQGAVGHFDYLSLGHFHSIGVWEQNDFDVMLNGSFVSNDDWVEEVLARKSQARQLLSFVHPKYGITGWHAIHLAK